MKRFTLFLTAVLSCFLFTFVAAQSSSRVNIISYFAGRISRLDSIDPRKMSHIIFCFGHLSGNRFKIDDAKDTLLLQKMVTLKSKNPALKVIVSLGGWGGCETCSDAFFTSEGRHEFAKSLKETVNFFKIDGIDLDWEYPSVRLDNDIDKNPVHKTTPEDKDNFTDLVRILRKTLGPQATISFAAGGFTTYLKNAIDWNAVIKEVDFVNMMTYDIINGYATTTGHHTGLYSTPHQVESTDHAIQYLIAHGVDPSKIILGAAFYARVWENVPPANHGLYQPGKFKDFIAYRDFPTRLSPAQGFKYYWDDQAQAPYMYNEKEKRFATFDDKKSIALKTKYVLDNKLGGIMFWELSLDTVSGGLFDTIVDTGNEYQTAP